MTASRLLFFKQFMAKPSGTGAVAPSSKRLATKMVRHLAIEAGEIVVELGPGTGVFTRELLAQGVRPENLICVEFNANFAAHLRNEFPAVNIIEGDASELPVLLKAARLQKVKRIISGIPLRSLPAEVGVAITKAIGQSLDTGGVAVQFTYFPISPLPLPTAIAAGLHGKRVAFEIRNTPPAFVWRYVKD